MTLCLLFWHENDSAISIDVNTYTFAYLIPWQMRRFCSIFQWLIPFNFTGSLARSLAMNLHTSFERFINLCHGVYEISRCTRAIVSNNFKALLTLQNEFHTSDIEATTMHNKCMHGVAYICILYVIMLDNASLWCIFCVCMCGCSLSVA